MTSVKMSNPMPEVTKLETGKATLQISFHLALNHMHGAFVRYFLYTCPVASVPRGMKIPQEHFHTGNRSAIFAWLKAIELNRGNGYHSQGRKSENTHHVLKGGAGYSESENGKTTST